MRICIFSRPFHPAVGGLERMAMTLATEFAGAGHMVEVVTDTESRDPADARFPFTITRTASNRQRYRAFRRADVVLLMNVSLHGVPIGMLANRPLVVSHQGIYGARQFGLKVYLRERFKHHLTRLLTNVACSTYVAAHLPTGATVIPNAYDDALFHDSPPATKERDFVFCGRLVPDKGVDVAIGAFAELLKHHPGATFTVVGDGPEKASLEALANALGCGDAIRFTGVMCGEGLRDELRKHRCMVVPSLWEEPFGIVALEGIACCTRVIVSRRGGLPEAVGQCGRAVEPTVSGFAGAMAEELQRTLMDSEHDVAFQRHRQEHLQAHQGRQIAGRYLPILSSVVQRQ